jgi:hypothetical protein
MTTRDGWVADSTGPGGGAAEICRRRGSASVPLNEEEASHARARRSGRIPERAFG